MLTNNSTFKSHHNQAIELVKYLPFEVDVLLIDLFLAFLNPVDEPDGLGLNVLFSFSSASSKEP